MSIYRWLHNKNQTLIRCTVPPGMTWPTSCTVRTESFSSVSTRITLWLSPLMDSTAFPGGGTSISGGLQDKCASATLYPDSLAQDRRPFVSIFTPTTSGEGAFWWRGSDSFTAIKCGKIMVCWIISLFSVCHNKNSQWSKTRNKWWNKKVDCFSFHKVQW